MTTMLWDAKESWCHIQKLYSLQFLKIYQRQTITGHYDKTTKGWDMEPTLFSLFLIISFFFRVYFVCLFSFIPWQKSYIFPAAAWHISSSYTYGSKSWRQLLWGMSLGHTTKTEELNVCGKLHFTMGSKLILCWNLFLM